MLTNLETRLRHKAINGWPLFLLFSIPISVAVLIKMLATDLSVGEGISSMIGYSVRFAIPFIFLAIGASSAYTLFPNLFTAWLARNRRYIGLCFAIAMFWQAVFIFTMTTFFRDFYFADVYYFRDELEGSVGYVFLTGMVITSFAFTRKKLSSQQWKYIQKGGVYFLWAYAFSVYWWNLYYYPNPETIDSIFYWMGFTAFSLRIAAWGKKRNRQNNKNSTPIALKAIGTAVVGFGLVASATGLLWQKSVTEFMTSAAWSAELELWLPFWPLEPFLPLLIIALGTWFYTHARRQKNIAVPRPSRI
jgi:DMSO/TMAO reductase YedYZ heme-binding membrane subunit